MVATRDYKDVINMKTAIKALASFACAALLSAGAVLPTQAAGRLTVAPTGETAVEETESAEAVPVVAVVAVAIEAMRLGYDAAYNEGVNQARTGGLTWSEWQGTKGWAIYFAANSVGLLGTAGYLGFRQGFTHECWSHYYCYAH